LKLRISFLRSLKSRVTLSMLAIFLLSIWSLTLYVSRTLRQDMERLLADQQSSAVAYVASDLNNEFTQRIHVLETVAHSIGPSLLEQPTALQKMLEANAFLLDLFNSGVIAVTRDGTAVADVPTIAGRRGTNYASNVATQTTLSTGQSVIGTALSKSGPGRRKLGSVSAESGESYGF
jgi:hypothetical protein